MKKYVKLVFGFIVGSIAYVAVYFVAGILMELTTSIAILPRFIDTDGTSLTAAAVGANGAALWLFEKIDNENSHIIAFSIWLIVLAAVYLIACLIGSDMHLLWYPILSVIINAACIKSCIDEIAEGKNKN